MNWLYGIFTFIVAFFLVGITILILSSDNGEETQVVSDEESVEDTAETEAEEDTMEEDSEAEETAEEANTSDVDTSALVNNGCVACHSVSALGMDGGNAGPDLSLAYSQTEDKHGKPLDEFLQEPTSAVMSTVIEGNPLSDEQIQAIVDTLEEADEQLE